MKKNGSSIFLPSLYNTRHMLHSLCRSLALLQWRWDSAGCGASDLKQPSSDRSRRTEHSKSPAEQTRLKKIPTSLHWFIQFFNLNEQFVSHLSDRGCDFGSSRASYDHLDIVFFVKEDGWTHGRHWPFPFWQNIMVMSFEVQIRQALDLCRIIRVIQVLTKRDKPKTERTESSDRPITGKAQRSSLNLLHSFRRTWPVRVCVLVLI